MKLLVKKSVYEEFIRPKIYLSFLIAFFMEFVALRAAYYCVNATSSFVCFTILLTGSNIQFHFTVKKKKNRF